MCPAPAWSPYSLTIYRIASIDNDVIAPHTHFCYDCCAYFQNDLNFNTSTAVRVVSHCPFLVAQYSNYRGRDLYATVMAMKEVGYPAAKLVEDVIRFPTMLSAPPERLRGWRDLLFSYAIAPTPASFGKLLKKSPFMFYLTPPRVMEEDLSMEPDAAAEGGGEGGGGRLVSATATGHVQHEVRRVLDMLADLDLAPMDLDKVVRTQPSILLTSAAEVSARVSFLVGLFTGVPWSPPKASKGFIIDSPREGSNVERVWGPGAGVAFRVCNSEKGRDASDGHGDGDGESDDVPTSNPTWGSPRPLSSFASVVGVGMGPGRAGRPVPSLSSKIMEDDLRAKTIFEGLLLAYPAVLSNDVRCGL